MYVLGFLVGRIILRRRARNGLLPLNNDQVDDFLIALFIGMLIGARSFYMLVYFVPPEGQGFSLLSLVAVWEGGLAFHGALIGMVAAIGIFAWRTRVPAATLLDGLGAAVPPGLFFGRLGNFANSELYGRVTEGPMGMAFPVWDQAGKLLGFTEPRHPSQLYQAVTEGLMAWVLVLWLAPRVPRGGVLFCIGITWYAFARFCVEFFREKDAQLNYLFGWMTMGQLLCVLMALAGIAATWWFWHHGPPVQQPIVMKAPEALPPSAPPSNPA